MFISFRKTKNIINDMIKKNVVNAQKAIAVLVPKDTARLYIALDSRTIFLRPPLHERITDTVKNVRHVPAQA